MAILLQTFNCKRTQIVTNLPNHATMQPTTQSPRCRHYEAHCFLRPATPPYIQSPIHPIHPATATTAPSSASFAPLSAISSRTSREWPENIRRVHTTVARSSSQASHSEVSSNWREVTKPSDKSSDYDGEGIGDHCIIMVGSP